MKIDFNKRLRNKAWWLAIVPAVCVLATQIAKMFGYELELTEWEIQIEGIIGTVFSILILLGVTVDTSTDGFSDKGEEEEEEE